MMSNVIILNADMEEPNCCRCDFREGDEKICEQCGSWWANYQRTIDLDKEMEKHGKINKASTR